eukprot:TRINITY_DN1446_c0_g4_i1.p1 TRINITY_DN1446_c0_g4~~TRINITY_DN1446_c0_g4_i1.p1  ORF type:complete len:215 (-),score=52.49 TRINITY_DN1446_c0_g4_i1:229-819(-)
MDNLLGAALSFSFSDFVLHVLAAIVFLIFLKWVVAEFFPAAKPPPPVVHPKPKPEPRPFTHEELREFNGKNGGLIYLAVKGKVYDVSSRANFYGPGGSYQMFAGRDVTRALAKSSFEEVDLANPSTEGFSFWEKDTLEGWIQSFEMKYEVVGFISPSTSTSSPTSTSTSTSSDSTPSSTSASASASTSGSSESKDE